MIRLWHRVLDRLRRERLAGELDRELRFHQMMLERDHRNRGLTPTEAASAARRDLGNRTTITEESRDMWSFIRLEEPLHDLRHAVRSLRRSPAFALIAGLTLALAIGANTAIFTVVYGVLLKPLPYGNPERLVGAWHDLPPVNMLHAQQTATTYFTYQRLAHTIEGIGVYQDGAVNVADPGGKGEPQRVATGWLSATVMPVLQVTPLRGRNFTDAEDLPDAPRVVIISETMWRTRFGGAPDIVGRTIDINGNARQVVGVMSREFRFPTAETQLWLPLGLNRSGAGSGGFNYSAVARLKPGVTAADAERDFAAVLPRMAELYPAFVPGVTTQMLLDQAKPKPLLIPMRRDITGGIAQTLWMIAAAAGLVLLVACANVTNLILVRLDGRQRELAVRESLGAGRGRVLMHFFAESVVLAVVATVAGVGLAWVAVRALVASGPAEIPRLAEVGVGGASVAFALVLAVLVGIACSIVPALRIGCVALSRALREGGRSGTASRVQHRVRGVLVAAQMALALVVLAGSGLLVRTFQHLNAIKPGFDPGHVVTLWTALPQARYPNDTAVTQFFDRITERVAQLPGASAAGLTSRVPLENYGWNQNPYYPENDATYATKLPPLQLFTSANGSYFSAIGIPLIKGRTFNASNVQPGTEAIISQRTSEIFYGDPTGAAAVGKRFRQLPGGTLYTVVGVVGNARDSSLAVPPMPTVYFPLTASGDSVAGPLPRTVALVVRTQGEPSAIIPAVQAALRELDPTLPSFEVRTMASVFNASMATLTFVILMLGAAAAVTLVLGAVGLYGVMAYVVTLRTRELGVRIALGAQPRQVAAMMTRQGLGLTAFGVAGGLTLFALVARFLRSFLFGVAPGDPVALGAASLTLVVIATLASWIPARRASRVDPAEALRAE